jgi:hypothetical protein
LKIVPLPQGIEVGVILHVRHVLVALAHCIAQQLQRRVGLELRRLLPLLVVQLLVLRRDRDAPAQEARGVVGVGGRVPAQVAAGLGGADGLVLSTALARISSDRSFLVLTTLQVISRAGPFE